MSATPQPTMDCRFVSLDRQTVCQSEFDEPDRYRDLPGARRGGPFIARGSGISYVAASFGEGVCSIGMKRFNRVLAFDPAAHRITVEAGMTLGDLQVFLLPNELHLPIQPGHPQITIGGCVACNVHGKNQFVEGIFENVVESLTLLHPDRGVQTLSRNDDPELFFFTLGGFGLSGIVLSVSLRLARLPGNLVRTEIVRVGSLAETFEQLAARKDDFDLLYSWNDVATFGRRMGQGFLVAGRYARRKDASPELSYRPIDPSDESGFRVPVLNRSSLPWINRFYLWKETADGSREVPLFDFLYPIAHLGSYFSMYGAKGFVEHKVLVPEGSWRDYLPAFSALLKKHGVPIGLVSVKLFRGAPRLLTFNGTGFSLSLDIGRSPAAAALLAELDELDCEFGARVNVYMDSRVSAGVVKRQYDGYDEFRAAREKFDPHRHFGSALQQRLAL